MQPLFAILMEYSGFPLLARDGTLPCYAIELDVRTAEANSAVPEPPSRPRRRSGHRGEPHSEAEDGSAHGPAAAHQTGPADARYRLAPSNGPAQSESAACGARPRRAYPP
jgi:hypothetical protein